MSKDKVIVLRGILDYAKVLGAARPHTGEPRYDKGPYWSVDITPDAKSMKLVKEFGIADKLRDPSPKDKTRVGKDKFLSLRVLEKRANGELNTPPKVVNLQGEDWDAGLIGNGSVGDIKVRVVEYGKGIQKGVYLQALRVLDHVPYLVEDFAPLSSDDEYFGAENDNSPVAESAAQDEDLEDDIPF